MRTLNNPTVEGDSTKQLTVRALDQPDPEGVNHLYSIAKFNPATNPSLQAVQSFTPPADHVLLAFQNGAIEDVGVNGITDEALLEVLIDRQKNRPDVVALAALQAALRLLQSQRRSFTR